MQLAVLVAVVCALIQGEGAAGPVGGSLWRTALALAGVLAAPLVAALGSRHMIGRLKVQPAMTPADHQRSWSRIESAFLGLWLLVVAATMFLLQWPRVVRTDWLLGQWPLVDDLLILAPVVAPLLLLWAIMHRLLLAAGATPPRLAAYLWLNTRHQLGLVLVPILVVLSFQEAIIRLWPAAEASGWLAWLHVPLLAVMFGLAPVALARIWRTSPLPSGELRDRLTALCRRERIGVRETLVWHTHGSIANAAVAGMIPGLRYIFLSDALLARLSADEVLTVVRHELGHVAGQHLPLRMLVLALPLAAWLALVDTTGATAVGPQLLPLAIIVPAVLVLYAVLVVGRYSRWLEHEADLAACMTRSGQIERAAAECFARALVKIVGRGRSSAWTNWLHPPVGERLALLALAIADPAAAVRFRRRLARIAWGIGLAYVLLAVVALW
jgi:Zn-dependent protease with chaperone function